MSCLTAPAGSGRDRPGRRRPLVRREKWRDEADGGADNPTGWFAASAFPFRRCEAGVDKSPVILLPAVASFLALAGRRQLTSRIDPDEFGSPGLVRLVVVAALVSSLVPLYIYFLIIALGIAGRAIARPARPTALSDSPDRYEVSL